MVRVNASGLHYKELNAMVRELLDRGEREIEIHDVCGQRYIGAGLSVKDAVIKVYGTPGNDLGAFMNGGQIEVFSNAQDGIGNTANNGTIVIHGDCGDITGHSMRGGKIYVRGSAGYRVGIHMKSYGENFPIMVIGGFVRDFLAEYMAGGLLIVLGLEKDEGGNIVGNFVGTGMHGGTLYIRGNVEEHQLGKEVKIQKAGRSDLERIRLYIEEFCKYFGFDLDEITSGTFLKLEPYTHRPYGKLYAY